MSVLGASRRGQTPRLPSRAKLGFQLPPPRRSSGPRVHHEIADAQIFAISQRPPAISDLLNTRDWRLDPMTLQIQPPIIEQEGWIVRGCLLGEFREELLT